MQQRVDPFIPVKKKPSLPQGQYGSQWLRKPEPVSTSTPPRALSLPPKPAVSPPPRSTAAQATTTVPPLRAASSPRSIDGVISRSTQPRTPTQSQEAISHDQFRTKPDSFDIIRRPAAPVAPRLPTAQPTPHVATTKVAATPLKHKAKARRIPGLGSLAKVQLPAIMLGAIGAGLAIQLLPLGEIVIGLYAVFALIRRVPSRTSFTLALFALIGVVVLLIIRGADTLSQNFAVYAFLLLVVGTISLALELRRQPA